VEAFFFAMRHHAYRATCARRKRWTYEEAEMSLGIQVTEIKQVLLADRWHEVEKESFALDTYEFIEGEQAVARGDGQLITSVGFMFREPGGQIVAGPLSSILAVQLPRTARS
jgi:hypothetical protein